ncbi:MAG: PD40 domain-containing protein [Chloroflexi bacterium]|nr:PD40 domain-containing protein [Chloroflexota bacterium]
MLVRAYRLTDKVGVVVLKSSVALVNVTLDGVTIATRSTRRAVFTVFGGLFMLVLGVGRLVFALLRRVAGIFWPVFRFLFGTIGGGALAMLGLGRRTAQSAGSSVSGTMARRAARAELEATLTEDPLRAQNRVLSGMMVVLLAVLLFVVWWATNPGNRAPVTPPSGVALLNFEDTTPGTPVPTAPNLPATAVPTATPLPAVLEVRGSLAYTVRERGQSDIWVVNVGSRAPLRLTNSPQDERDPAWSPDGRRLAYASNQDGNWEIYLYEPATGTTTRLTYELSFQGAPSWSPDGLWLAYESYQGNNLDIYVVPIDGSQPALRVTSNPAPDFSPAWSPDGRRIAYISLRDGNADMYVFSLDNPDDEAAVNLTASPTRQEDRPVWSPDGKLLAFSALDEGAYKVFVKPADEPQTEAQVLERGRTPAWAPNGASLVFAVDSFDSTQLIVSPFTESGISTLVLQVPLGSSRPTWTSAPLPAALVNSGGLPVGVAQPLFVEQQNPPDADGLYKLDTLLGVTAPSAYLNERVNDSFNALRERALEAAGWDFLGELEDAFWALDRLPQPGEERRNWYMTGRQFGVNRNLVVGFPARMEIVREDLDINTYWRVYVRVTDEAQSGQLGEPLRQIPWDLASRNLGDVEAYDQGGRLKPEVPTGYYIDFTQLAADYGWQRVPAGTDWRANVNSINYWLFRKTDGLTWYPAMRELYTDGQLGGFAPTPTTTAPQAETTDES